MTLIEGEVYFERKDAFGIDSQSLTKQKLDKQKNKGEAKPLPIRNSYVIRGATIYPISGSPLVGASVVIENGKITAVGKEVPIPNGAFEVQANGMRVYPGFFDGYSSVGLQEISPIAVMGDLSELGDNQPDMDALTALWVESAHFGPARYAGVTNGYMAPSRGTIAGQGAVINMNGYSSEQFGVKRKAALMVNFTTPRTFNFDLCDDQVTANQLLGIEVDDNELTNEQREQFYDMLGGAPAPQQQPTTQDPQNDVERYFDRVIAYLKDRKTDKKSQTDLRMEAMIPYVTGQKEVMLNVRSAASIRSAITFAKKYKLKAILRGANEAWKETKAIKESGYPVIINPAGNSTLNANSTESSWDPYDTPYVLPGILERAGIKFCFQTGDGSNLMNLPCRVGESCAYGLSLPGALRALTLSPAEIFGVQDQLGSIEAGKMANLIICDGDPFEFTSSVRNVFIKGEPQKMESKHTMLRDKYSTRK
jgi:imidazolonepropionase-like amidohydrolase